MSEIIAAVTAGALLVMAFHLGEFLGRRDERRRREQEDLHEWRDRQVGR